LKKREGKEKKKGGGRYPHRVFFKKEGEKGKVKRKPMRCLPIYQCREVRTSNNIFYLFVRKKEEGTFACKKEEGIQNA